MNSPNKGLTAKGGRGQKMIRLLIKRRTFIIWTTILFAIASSAYVLLVVPAYRAEISLHIQPAESASLLATTDVQKKPMADGLLTREIARFKDPLLLANTVERYHLTTQIIPADLTFINRVKMRLAGQSQVIEINDLVLPDNNIASDYYLLVDDAATGRYSLYNEKRQKLLSGTVGQRIQQEHYQILLASITAPTGSWFLLRKRSKLDAIAWLDNRLSFAKHDKTTLNVYFSHDNQYQSEQILNHLSNNYRLGNIQRNSLSAADKLRTLNELVPNIKLKRTLASDALQAFEQQNPQVYLDKTAQESLQALLDVAMQLNELTAQEGQLDRRISKDDPQYQLLLGQRQVLTAEQQRVRKQIQKLPQAQQHLLYLHYDWQVMQQSYLELLDQVQALTLLNNEPAVKVEQLAGGAIGELAIRLKLKIVVFVSVFACLFAGVAVLLGLGGRKGVRLLTDIEALGIPVYACISHSVRQMRLAKKKQKKPQQHSLLATSFPDDLAIEALRALRAKVHFALLEAQCNILVVAGVSAQAGQSFVVANFAALIAQSNTRVLLIDADLGHGSSHEYFNLPVANGLGELLTGQQQITELIYPTQIKGLDLLSRGKSAATTAEIISERQAFIDCIGWASSKYDLVIILSSVQSAPLLKNVPAVSLLVGRYQHNTLQEIVIARQQLAIAGVHVQGFIFNNID